MPASGWYVENMLRDYPFQTRTLPLPDSGPTFNDLPQSVLVDFGATLADSAGFLPGEHTVYLARIARLGSIVTIDFRTDAPGAAGTVLRFQRAIGFEFTVGFSDAVYDGDTPVGLCDAEVPWWGFAATGNLDVLTTLIPDGDELLFDPSLWQVEPAQLQSLARTYVAGVTVGNFPRTQATPPGECDQPVINSDIVLSGRCLQGTIRLQEGYNCSLRQDTRLNGVVLSAAVGAGDGEPCDEQPYNDEESLPEGSQFYSGGPGCGEVLKTINGVGGRNLVILAGPGIRVYASDVQPNTLVIDRTLEDFALCFPAGSSESASSSSSSSSSSA